MATNKTLSKPTLDDDPCCNGKGHGGLPIAIDTHARKRAAAIFRALGDPQRLRWLLLLEASEPRVSEVSELLKESMPAISQRLRPLKSVRIVRSRRVGMKSS